MRTRRPFYNTVPSLVMRHQTEAKQVAVPSPSLVMRHQTEAKQVAVPSPNRGKAGVGQGAGGCTVAIAITVSIALANTCIRTHQTDSLVFDMQKTDGHAGRLQPTTVAQSAFQI